MTKQNMVGHAKERYYHSIGSKVSILFGISMALYCILVISQRIRTQMFDSIFFMTFVTLALSIYILLDKNRNILRSMGLYSLGMALTRLPWSIMYILFPNPEPVIFLGLFFFGVAINMFVSAWYYLHGKCRGYISSTVLITILWVAYLIMFVATLFGVMPDVNGTVFQRVLAPELLAANVILFSAYLLVLCTDEIHDNCEMEIAYKHIQTFRSMTDAGYDSSVSRKDAKTILAGPSVWEKSNVGLVESEAKFVVSYTECVLFGTIQKWKNDDRVFVTISENIWDETMIEATRFAADEIVCDGNGPDDCTHIMFRCRNGDLYSIEVLDDNMEVIV